MTSTPPLLISAHAGGVLRLVLNRPDARNALSSELMGLLQAALDGAAADNATRVVVIAANGPVFCAGHDLKEMTAHRALPDRGASAFAALFTQCSSLMQTIVRLPKPVIAEVQGMAAAAGCQLVASCDLAIASISARFVTPGIDIGLFCSTPMVALSRNIGRKAAMEMLLTGDIQESEDAIGIGLVNQVVFAEILTSTTMALALKIAAKPRAALKIGKEAFYSQVEMPLGEAYDYTSQVMTQNMLNAEAEEGIEAFLEKRKPQWPN